MRLLGTTTGCLSDCLFGCRNTVTSHKSSCIYNAAVVRNTLICWIATTKIDCLANIRNGLAAGINQLNSFNDCTTTNYID